MVTVTMAHVHKVKCTDELVQDTEEGRDSIIEEEAFEMGFERCRVFF